MQRPATWESEDPTSGLTRGSHPSRRCRLLSCRVRTGVELGWTGRCWPAVGLGSRSPFDDRLTLCEISLAGAISEDVVAADNMGPEMARPITPSVATNPLAMAARGCIDRLHRWSSRHPRTARIRRRRRHPSRRRSSARIGDPRWGIGISANGGLFRSGQRRMGLKVPVPPGRLVAVAQASPGAGRSTCASGMVIRARTPSVPNVN